MVVVVTRVSLSDLTDYPKTTVEKVERLLDLLDEVYRHPFLRSRLLLHGGTALNVFHLGFPRLSVDADFTYIGEVEKDRMLADRPHVIKALTELSASLGYEVKTGPEEHAGQTLYLSYRNLLGNNDTVKTDVIFLNRSPLLLTDDVPCAACTPQIKARTSPCRS